MYDSTVYDAALLYEKYGELQEFDYTMQRNVWLNAYYNSHRGKSDKFMELFNDKKKVEKPKTKEEAIEERNELFSRKTLDF